MRIIIIFIGFSVLGVAETHLLTLRQAVETAMKQNPDVILSRLDEQRARASARVAKDPFSPKLYGGSGLAYTLGYPTSIEGSAPSIFQARADLAIFNRPKSFELAAARETARGAAIQTASKSDDIAYRTASLFLDTQQIEHSLPSLEQESQALDRVREAIRLRVVEGRELPLTVKRSELNLARARQRHDAAGQDLAYLEESLAVVLGFAAGDRVKPAEDDRLPAEAPATEETSIAFALENNKEIRRLNSDMQAKGFEVRAQKSQRYPQVDLVAQYALFAKYNYSNFFNTFSRHNGEFGVSVKIPLLIGAAPSGLQEQAEVDLAKLRTRMNDVRNQTTLETRRSFQDVKRAESARDVSKLDLEVAREQLRVLLDQLDEGKVTRQAVEEARLAEQEKWIAFYDSQHAIEKAKLNLLKQTGTLQAALR